MKMSRQAVYAAIDTERDYQDSLARQSRSQGRHEVSAFLTYMRDYLTEAEHIASRDWSPEADQRTLEIIRKVTALGVVCMEQHGVTERVVPSITGDVAAAFQVFTPLKCICRVPLHGDLQDCNCKHGVRSSATDGRGVSADVIPGLRVIPTEQNKFEIGT